MTEKELNQVSQMIQRYLPEGTASILAAVPPQEFESHQPDECPLQTASDRRCTESMRQVLDEAAKMVEHGIQPPMYQHPVEKTQ